MEKNYSETERDLKKPATRALLLFKILGKVLIHTQKRRKPIPLGGRSNIPISKEDSPPCSPTQKNGKSTPRKHRHPLKVTINPPPSAQGPKKLGEKKTLKRPKKTKTKPPKLPRILDAEQDHLPEFCWFDVPSGF